MSDSTNQAFTPPEGATAALIIADGTVFWGHGVGATGDAIAAAVTSSMKPALACVRQCACGPVGLAGPTRRRLSLSFLSQPVEG